VLEFYFWKNNKNKKTVNDFTDDELLTYVSNMMDWSQEKVFMTACDEVNIKSNFDDFFRTGRLPTQVRIELRKAYRILYDDMPL